MSFTVAYIGGLLTLFSPCSALLVPSFFAYAFSSRTKLTSRTIVFFLGLLAGLLPLGVTLGALGGVLAQLRGLTMWGGIIIAAFGVCQILSLPLPRLETLRRVLRSRHNKNPAPEPDSSKRKNPDSTSPAAIFLLGLTYGLAATGCSGPILGAIAAFALTGGSALQGLLIMLFFACGMFTPVVILAFLWRYIPRKILTPKPVKVLGHPTTVGNLISGTIMVMLGLIMAFFGGGALSASLLSPSKQAELENSARLTFAAVPNWLMITLLVLIIAYTITYFWGKHSPHSDTGK